MLIRFGRVVRRKHGPLGSSCKMIGKVIYYLKWFWKCKVRHQRIPLNGSVIVTDQCNLSCQHCTVSHLGYALLNFEQLREDIQTLYEKGSRVLVLTGGEPFLWQDPPYDLEDVVRFSKKLGFFRVVVCTNGTLKLKSAADYLWVSLDGFPEEHNRIRGNIYDKVWNNILKSDHSGIYINFTISAVNVEDFERAAEVLFKSKRIRGIFFHLYTPYLGSDTRLNLTACQRALALTKLVSLKKKYFFKVTNTIDGLRVLRDNSWVRPVTSSITINRGESGVCCCRAGIYDEGVCAQCGCSPAVETYVLEKLYPLAIIENFRFL